MQRQEIDFMEYDSNGVAQAAYIPSLIGVVTQQNTTYDGDTSITPVQGGWGQGFKVSTTNNISKITLRLRKKDSGTTGTVTVYIYSDDGSGKPNVALATFSSLAVSNVTTSYVDYDFTGSFIPTANTQYHIVLIWTGGTAGDWFGHPQNSSSSYADGKLTYYEDGWNFLADRDTYFKIYQDSTVFQCYSESSIKVQGSYSLKCIANQIDSLNATLTRTLSPSLNLTTTPYRVIKSFVRASRIGTNFQVGFNSDVAGTTFFDVPIVNADTWQTVRVLLSGIPNDTKVALKKIIFKITDADADNVIYIDNLFAENRYFPNSLLKFS